MEIKTELEKISKKANELTELIEFLEDDLEDNLGRYIENLNVEVVSNSDSPSPEVLRTSVEDDKVNVEVDMDSLLQDFLDDIEIEVSTDDGEIIESNHTATLNSICVKIFIEDMINEEVKERIAALEFEERETSASVYRELGVSGIDELKNKLNKLAMLERIIST